MAGKELFVFAVLGLVGLAHLADQMAATTTSPAQMSTTPRAPRADPEPAIGNGIGGVTLMRASDGHFYADARVNGTAVRFLVDTGASGLVLTHEDARRSGIGAGDYSDRAIGAGGEVRLMPVVLNQIAMGPIVATRVEAYVAEEGSLPVSLLGQSYLSRIGSVSISGDEMVLR